jgi:hypothetical protein
LLISQTLLEREPSHHGTLTSAELPAQMVRKEHRAHREHKAYKAPMERKAFRVYRERRV